MGRISDFGLVGPCAGVVATMDVGCEVTPGVA